MQLISHLILVASAFAATILLIDAQVVYKDSVLRTKYKPWLDSSVALKWNFATFSLPPFINNDELLFQERKDLFLDDSNQGEQYSGFYQFGKAFEVDLDLQDGTWMTLPDGGRAWRLALHSRNALSLNVLFEEFMLPEEGEFFVSSVREQLVDGEASLEVDETRGPFTFHNNKAHGKFSTFPVAGNTLLLEYYAPLHETRLPKIRVSHIVHGYKENSAVKPELVRSGSCNINVNCKEGDEWTNEIRSVVMLLSRFGQGYCSGAMVNNAKKDGRQLILTAYHCAGEGDHSQDMLLFNHQVSACDSRSPPATPDRQSAQGLKKLSGLYDSDFALFELEEQIPTNYNVYLSGWSARPVSEYVPATPVGIHHPSADVKKISFSHSNCSEACWGGSCRRGASADHWRVGRWDLGTTEPGSSGSPLFDGLTHRIVGQLHGGSASCYNREGYDVYGKISHSWDKAPEGKRLKDHLDPEDSGVLFMDGADLNAILA